MKCSLNDAGANLRVQLPRDTAPQGLLYPQSVVRAIKLNVRRPSVLGNSRCLLVAEALRIVGFFISIMGSTAIHAHLSAQQVTTVAPPAQTAAAPLPDAQQVPPYPDAVPLPPGSKLAHIDSDQPQKLVGSRYTADGNVQVTYGDRTLGADHVEYDRDTGEVILTGHVVVTEAENDVHIEASHGSFNLNEQTGRFYDVTGSMGLRRKPAAGAAIEAQRQVYANGNPFLFTGKLVVKTGPKYYRIFGGTVTSCQLPRPDWLLSAGEFRVDDEKAIARNSIFHVMGIPALWLPVATHPVNAGDRQTGILIPEIGVNSASKGDTVGEQVYWAIDRSTDLTAGAIYYSSRGYEETGGFRYRGFGQDFARAHFSSLQDRGYTPFGGSYINQSGTDVLLSARHDVGAEDAAAAGASGAPSPVQTRLAGDLEYLSSFPYREAFSTNFNQAVSTDVISTVYATREWDGMAASLEGDRYQGEKHVQSTNPVTGVVTPEAQVHIFHAPALEFTTTDHSLGSSGLEWSFDSSAAALKRSQPEFTTSGMVERLDLHPELTYPLHFGGWSVRPSVGGRETFYSRSRLPPVPGQPPVESEATLNRSDFEFALDLRPPVLDRTFDSGLVKKLLRQDVKHTIEPELTYRLVSGIDNFPNTLRFDAVDVASNTNEIEYGVTQRLFLRRTGNAPCREAAQVANADEVLDSAGMDADSAVDPGLATGRTEASEAQCGNREWISWRVAQKYYFDPTFGGAVVNNGPRSIVDATLDLTGIAFLTGPRDLSPITSRLRVRTSERTDAEWDFDFDSCSASVAPSSASGPQSCQAKFTADNVYIDVHQDELTHARPVRAGIGYARLNAPARSYVDGNLSSVADFDQMRVLFGFGGPTRPKLSALASAGIDLDLGTVQYGSILTSYNWNCCGLSVEYRKYELGTARNDNGYKFNFTLANIGSAGNIRHADQMF